MKSVVGEEKKSEILGGRVTKNTLPLHVFLIRDVGVSRLPRLPCHCPSGRRPCFDQQFMGAEDTAKPAWVRSF